MVNINEIAQLARNNVIHNVISFNAIGSVRALNILDVFCIHLVDRVNSVISIAFTIDLVIMCFYIIEILIVSFG